jgi:putative oxygen-independent coproporphyrinogen III oxidase
MLQLPPLSLYIHIPWCVRKCPYCDFNSHAQRGDLPESSYVDRLLSDLRNDAVWAQGRAINSIFFGGGTPRLLSAEENDRILNGVKATVPLASDCEITLEANPGTFEQDKFRGFRRAGVNRLSIGVQSFNDKHLHTLGRIHNSGEAKRAIGIAQQAGFDNFNIDLMHGLPEQSVDDALADIDTALSLGAPHLSWYQLTIEKNTAFFSSPPLLPDEDTLCDIADTGLAAIRAAGLEQYEVSAYCRPGHPSRHNINYWQFGDYLGIGAGAHGKITLAQEQRVIRSQKTRAPEHYLSNDTLNLRKYDDIASKDMAFEFMLNALRLRGGVPANLFEARTGIPLQRITPLWLDLRARGLMVDNDEVIATSERGALFLNDVLEAFLDYAPRA